MTSRRIIGLFGLVVAFTLNSAGNRLPADDRVADRESDVLEEFSISNDVPLLPVSLGEKTYSFLLDTGASYSVFDTALVDHLGRPVRQHRVATAGHDIIVSEYPMPALQLGRIQPPPDARALSASLLEARQALDERLDGIIGMDFLRSHIVQLDFDGQKIRFLKSLPSEPGDRFPIVFGKESFRNVPRFNVKLESADTVFMIDTGFNGTLAINSQLFDELDYAGRVGIRSTFRFATAGGTHSQVSGRLDNSTIGQFTHQELIVDRHVRNNMVGLGYLKRFLVTFDFPQNAIHLKPGNGFSRIDEWDLSGLHIWRVKGEVVIDKVDLDSPAASLGLQATDVVMEVDGQPAAAVSLTKLRARLRDTERPVTLTIRRGETTLSVELQPQEFRTKSTPAVESPQSERPPRP